MQGGGWGLKGGLGGTWKGPQGILRVLLIRDIRGPLGLGVKPFDLAGQAVDVTSYRSAWNFYTPLRH